MSAFQDDLNKLAWHADNIVCNPQRALRTALDFHGAKRMKTDLGKQVAAVLVLCLATVHDRAGLLDAIGRMRLSQFEPHRMAGAILADALLSAGPPRPLPR